MRQFGWLPPVAALVALAAVPSVAHAHFIWATIDEGKVRFALLEDPFETPDERFGKYVAKLTTKLPLGEIAGGARSCVLPKRDPCGAGRYRARCYGAGGGWRAGHLPCQGSRRAGRCRQTHRSRS
ncbi:MAG: hypothetical protein QM758_10445 [Armatimonas sp.]